MDKNKINTKKQKENSDALKTLRENDLKRQNQYKTMFREMGKAKKRIAFLESESFKQKKEAEKHFTHIEDEVVAIQSTLDFFTTETADAEETIQDAEVEEIEEVKERRKIMGVDFSDSIIAKTFLPEKNKK